MKQIARLIARALHSPGDAAELVAIGGATRSRLWMQVKADVTRRRVVIGASDVATPMGAAMLAALGTGEADVADLVIVPGWPLLRRTDAGADGHARSTMPMLQKRDSSEGKASGPLT